MRPSPGEFRIVRVFCSAPGFAHLAAVGLHLMPEKGDRLPVGPKDALHVTVIRGSGQKRRLA
jgi:hypothetical protein